MSTVRTGRLGPPKYRHTQTLPWTGCGEMGFGIPECTLPLIRCMVFRASAEAGNEKGIL